jgi:hypothetical protein
MRISKLQYSKVDKNSFSDNFTIKGLNLFFLFQPVLRIRITAHPGPSFHLHADPHPTFPSNADQDQDSVFQNYADSYGSRTGSVNVR